MPVKTGRKLPRARVDAKVAQAAVRLARHVPAAPSTAPRTPPARPSTEASSSAVRLALHRFVRFAATVESSVLWTPV